MSQPAPPGTSALAPARRALEWAGLALAVVVLTSLLRALVAQAFYIPSGSMLPQLEVDDRIVVSRLSYRLHDPRRGDIVVFDAPPALQGGGGDDRSSVLRFVLEGIAVLKPAKTEYVKRVVGLPGEAVSARGGRVLVDGRPLVEPYLPPSATTVDFGPVTVPESTVFVMGDNRSGSFDSRGFGPIPRSSIVGRAIVKVWPLPSACWL